MTSNLSACEKLLAIEHQMCSELNNLKFTPPIDYVYNPLLYAKDLHENFIKKYFENCSKKILFLGMNPGPWGMCQTGIVFGDKDHVKEWLKLCGQVNKPKKEHPRKKITGLDCSRKEISGKKFWGFFRKLCQTPEQFFQHSFVYNLCCLAFVDTSGKNITPPEIKDIQVRNRLLNICNETFVKIIKEFKFEIVIGVGKFAEKNAITELRRNGLSNVKVLSIPHPSPRSAKIFRVWEEMTLKKLKEYDLLKYF
ncbi:hypothetical protein RUM43_007571 [Polyplax serrata]|uniref:Uracil-DNA glycosylase-like domain-containing protein n=1 Tax=Polyplax serrata TaxID=468196 RepID=A0AAN8P630_POLSC